MNSQEICAVVITFNPDQQVLENLKETLKQVDKVVVVDNTPLEGNEIIKKINENYPKIELIINKSNLGIAKALNQGINYAIENNFLYILTLDQDSCPKKEMVMELTQAMSESDNGFTIVTPQTYDKFNSFEYSSKIEIIDKAVTSGMLLPGNVIEKCGLMKEEMFIDYVDFEYCLRFRKMGGVILSVPKAKLKHSLGDLSEFKIFGKTYWPTNHNPLRRYYITRNRIYVWKKYFFSFPKWVLRDLKFFIVETFLICLIEKDKFKKLWAITKGIVVGFLKK